MLQVYGWEVVVSILRTSNPAIAGFDGTDSGDLSRRSRDEEELYEMAEKTRMCRSEMIGKGFFL